MRLLSWNVNGLRALYRNGFLEWLYHDSPDILSLQEVKADPADLPDAIRLPKGYTAYFSPSSIKKGYSGVACYSKKEPSEVEYGIGIKEFDNEGRVITAYFPKFVLVNAYFPNTGRDSRVPYKLSFNDAILSYLKKLKKRNPYIILCGDFNVAHEDIDLARPKENEGFPGFRPEERAWIDELIDGGFIDTFRHFYPEKIAYSWWDLKTRARDRGVGWRIDYFFVSREFITKVKRAFVLDHIFGSDHAPVGIEINVN